MIGTEDREIVPGLVSVVVPVFNRERMLLEAVSCVEAQTYRHVELILVDDGSTDGSGALCDRLAAARPATCRAIHQPNAGPGGAREAGRRTARGEYIQYLDSDDWLEPRKLEAQVATLEGEPWAGVCYCRTLERQVGSPSSEQPTLRTGDRLESIFPAFLAGRLWQTVTPLWRRTACDRIGAWANLRVEEDMEYDARAGAEGVRPVWCPEWLAEHRHHEGPRASGGGTLDPAKLADRARAHALVYRHSLRAGVDANVPEMQRYARELFLLARQCGAAGLPEESRRLFALAREASGPERAKGLDFKVYRMAASVLGWALVGGLACRADGLRRGAVEPVS